MTKLSLKVLLLPNIFDLIFNKFLVSDSPQVMRTCKKFYKLIKSNLSQQLRHVISCFDYQYSKSLRVQNPCIKYIRKKTQHQSNPIDIAIELQFKLMNTLQTTYTINYSYQYYSYAKNNKKTFCWQIQFNIVKSKRQIWIYKQETRNHFVQENISLVQDVLSVRQDDVLVIRIPYLTKFGFVDLKLLKFYKLVKQNIFKRECEIQKHFDWVLYKYFDHPIQFEIQDIIRLYPEYLQVVEIRCAGTDYVNFKIRLRAKKEGILGQMLDHFISIRNESKSLRVVLKKKGCYDQEGTYLQLRIGDELIIYHTPNY